MREFTEFLKKFKSRINTRFALQAMLNCVLGFAIAVHVYYLLWMHIPHESAALMYANIGIRASLALVIIYFVWQTYHGFWDNRLVARFLDRQEEHNDDLFQNTYELAKKADSVAIVNALAESANQRIGTTKYRVPAIYPPWMMFSIVFLFLGLGSIWALSWGDFQLAFKQFYTNKRQEIVYKQFIELSPGSLQIGRNQAIEIKLVKPDTRLAHKLFYRTDKEWRELGMANGSYLFTRLDNSIEYYAENSVCKSPVYKINVLDEPIVKNWIVEINPPAYTGMRAWADTLSYGNIEAWKHSMVKLAITTNIPVKTAVMVFDDASRVPMQALDNQSFITQIKVDRARTWYLELTDGLGRKSKPEEKSIRILDDNPPQIKISFPGEDVTLNQNMLLPLIISADDDFGLRNLSLKLQVNAGEITTINIQSVIPNKMFATDFMLDMKSTNLFPGDVVTYWAEIYDNSPEVQKAESTKFKARFPSIEEIYNEIERQQDNKKSELESALKESKDLQKEFEDKRRELLKENNPKWEEKKQLEKMLSEQEKLSQQVQEVADNYENLIEKMQANDALSPETLDKMKKIQELMQEISNEDLQKAMEKLENSLKNIKPEDLKKAMENFKFSMEDFSKKIEQTLQLLESIKKEQAVQKALQISEEMEKMQKALSDRTMDKTKDNKDLAADQKKISDNYDKLKSELDKIKDMLDSQKDKDARQKLDELMKEMKQSEAQKDMQNSENQLKNDQRSQSQASQSSAMEKLRKFTMMLAQMKNSMSSGSSGQTMKAIQTATRELLIFSKKHESTAARYRNDPYQIVPDLIAHSEGIQIALNKLFSEVQVLMIIPPKFFIDMTDTNRSYRDVFGYVNEMQFYQIPTGLANIQKGINLMVYDLMQAMQNSSSGGGSGSGMQSLMQTLEQMGQEQMAMNMLTQQLMMQMQSSGGRMDSAMQQQIQKLAQDQERLAENLKRALQNSPEAQKQGNAIKQITEEMDSISRQLRNNQLSQDLLERQERIISKMLDAQRSINKREFSEKRKGETADQNAYKSAPNTIDYNSLRRNSLLDDNFKAYPSEYQKVIMQYLKSLNEKIDK
ncbi:MAG: hypothetical protein CVU50_00620 [Candidatus Cloacimonetes bacterium HGW-Cloacimonetes-3]|jgi:hypothetical protein|nr:MAG: hypothetical protein CVU50_00620 [Candidatus Cloacimonetes bacterium HGW-Cloacimonetes-3]